MKTASSQVTQSSPRSHWMALLLGAVTLFAISYHAQAGGKNDNPRVMPPQASYRGLSYSEWGAEWWKALFAIPVETKNGVDQHPYLDGGTFGTVKDVLSIIGPFGTADVNLTIPAGTPILLAVVNAEWSTLEAGDPEAKESDLAQVANEIVDATSGVFAKIDGVAVKNLEAYRTQSPLFEFGPLPLNNLFDYFELVDSPAAGKKSLAVDAGIYLMLNPLSVGAHTIHVGGNYPEEIGGAFQTSFHITVVPHKP
ncbi:MAG: hypothetical protein AB9869_31695 [Verrucomicrobiia bacterium]